MFIFTCIVILSIYTASATVKFKNVPKYKYSYFIPFYIMMWLDLAFIIVAAFNLPIDSSNLGLVIAIVVVVINISILSYAIYKHKTTAPPK